MGPYSYDECTCVIYNFKTCFCAYRLPSNLIQVYRYDMFLANHMACGVSFDLIVGGSGTCACFCVFELGWTGYSRFWLLIIKYA